MRYSYGNAMLKRCKEMSSAEEEKEKKWQNDGTYLCAWLKRYIPTRFQCSCCRRIVESNRLGKRSDHDYPCYCGRQETLYDW
eukprot:10599866-Ditylum_brightwellii.AAC.1